VHRTINANAGLGSNWIALTGLSAAGAPKLIVGGIAIDPTDVNIAVVVYDGFTSINPKNRTKHIFRTTDGGDTWTDISGTDGGTPQDNLPDLPLHSVVIDPSTLPHPILVATDSAVLQTVDNGATWQVFGLGLPPVDCVSLAIDTTATPPVIRVGTYGRSVYEVQRTSGPRIVVLSNLAFGVVSRGTNVDLSFRIFNVGNSVLVINNITSSLNTDFQVVTPPSIPLMITAGNDVTLSVRFTPSRGGNQKSSFSIDNNDPICSMVRVPVSGAST
jgi:hypothetical protein